ncbi:zinc knuckle [Ancylostoma caninum]|uniref:Zinc knuckle n=1 Tax=Ancylostoma caninum TaxID=29170 RepID=A0A368FZV8_ANCCA|nr:zinc knuckle [Ancylostoma caninum]
MRIERRQLTIRNVARQRRVHRQDFRRKSVISRNDRQATIPTHTDSAEDFITKKDTGTSFEKREEALTGRNSKGETIEQSQNGKGCYNCGAEGHIARKCPQTTGGQGKKRYTHGRSVSSLSERVKAMHCAMTRRREAQSNSETFGIKTVIDVEIFGRRWKGLLDTGSEISVLPVKVLQYALERGIDIDEMIPEIPMDDSKHVYDASRQRMQFWLQS